MTLVTEESTRGTDWVDPPDPGALPARVRIAHPGGEVPAEGTVPPAVARALVGVLRPFTGTQSPCRFAVWEGWAALAGLRTETDVRLRRPGRDYLLLTGPLEAATESFDDVVHQTANLWWPHDAIWLVAVDVDDTATLVAGPAALADMVLAHPELSARRADLS